MSENIGVGPGRATIYAAQELVLSLSDTCEKLECILQAEEGPIGYV